MKSKMLYDFVVNKEDTSMNISKEFNADRQLVWDCFTKQELLEQWFAPKPFTTKTKSMEFKEGGHWHYAMVDPNGNEYWGITKFLEVQPIDFYTSLDAFSNADGEINKELPESEWMVSFTESDGVCLVTIDINYQSLEDMETVVKMGMKEGLTATLEELDKLIQSLV